MRYLTRGGMAAVDRIAMKDFGIKVGMMMELAGMNLARFVSKLKPNKVTILYGKGNNGAGGLVAARHLAIQGVKISIVPASKEGNENIKYHLKILRKMGIKPSKELGKSDVIIDALIGYNLKGNPKGNFAKLIEKANNARKRGTKIVAFDLPSGLDASLGEYHNPSIMANYTLTLGLPKVGLRNAKVRNVFLANIGIPKEVYKKVGVKVENYFKQGDIVRIA